MKLLVNLSEKSSEKLSLGSSVNSLVKLSVKFLSKLSVKLLSKLLVKSSVKLFVKSLEKISVENLEPSFTKFLLLFGKLDLNLRWRFYDLVTHDSNIRTGKSFSEALILATSNPQYDKGLFIDLPVLA